MAEDYYKVLGVKRDASQSDIQRAYRELARKYHPDMNPDDASAKERFQRVQQAYDVLGNAEKREMYDRYGSSFESAGGGPGGYGFHPGGPGGGYEEMDFSQIFGDRGAEGFADIFRQFTGGRSRARRPRQQPGADLQHEIEVPFQTAIVGGEAAVTVQRPGNRVETLTVKIPAGIEDGKKIRLRGQGEPSPTGGKPGDILIKIRVASHPYFQRRGNNLEVTVPVTLAEAALGGKIDVPTPKGTITLTIPPGTSSGRRLRVKGHGVAPSKSTAGDLFAVIRIVLPPDLDDQAKQAIRDIDARCPLEPRTDLRW
jgi:DnaJ-class molecular chaperone